MASYNADINVNVNVFDKKLRDLERRIQALDRIANPKKPLTKAQATEELKKAKQELEINKRARAVIERKNQAQKKLEDYAAQVRLRKKEELNRKREELNYEERLLRLANARKLQESRLISLERGGAFEATGRSAEISGLLRKRDRFPENPAIQERVATALGRILTLQNAINRADIKNIGQKQRIDDYNKRIQALRRIGVSEGDLRDVIKRRAQFIEASDKRQDVIANKRELQLKRQLGLLERKNRLALKAFNTEAKVQSTPLSRAAKRTVLGTPEAEAKKAAFYQQKAIQQAKGLDLEEKQINKTLDDQRKLREKNAAAAKRLADQQLRAAKRVGGPRSALPQRTILGSDEAIRKRAAFYQRKAIQDARELDRQEKLINRTLDDQRKLRERNGRAARKLADQRLKASKKAGGPRSELAPRTILGSDEAIRKKAAFYDKKAIRDQREKNKAKREELRLAKLLSKEREKESRSNDRQAAKRKANRGKFAQNLSAGVGFPLLFGGGPGSIIGGALGALGGFGGSVLGSAIGQQIDKLGAAALSTADIFLKLTDNLEDLTSALGRGSQGGVGGTAAFLASQGLAAEAAQTLTKRFDEVYGFGAARRFEKLAQVSRDMKGVLTELGIEFQLAMEGPLRFVLDLLKQIRLEPKPQRELARLLAIQANDPRGLSIREKARLEELQGASSQPGAEAFSAQALDQLRTDTAKIERQSTRLVEKRLTARRDDYAIAQGNLKVDKTQVELNRTRNQLAYERKLVNKDTQKILELQTRELELQNQQDRDLAEQANARLLAERAIRRDVVSQRTQQLNLDKSTLNIARRRDNILSLDADQYRTKLRALKIQEEIELKLLEYNREMALQGVREEEVRQEINKSYEYKLFVMEQSLKLQREEVKLAEIARRDSKLAREQRLENIYTDQLRNQQSQIRQLDPGRAVGFASQGLGFFGQSGLFEANRLADSAAQLEKYNEEIAELQTRLAKVRESSTLVQLEDVRRIDAIRKEIEEVTKKRDAYETLQPAIDRAAVLQARYNDALAAVSPGINSLVNGFRDVVAGTKSAQEAFADFLNTIADQLIQTAATMIAQYIALGIARKFAFGGGFQFSGGSADAGLKAANLLGGVGSILGFANGGTPPVNRPSIVGERGPELFVPRSSGTIIPNDALGGGSTVVNITVNSETGNGTTDASGDRAAEGRRLGKLMEAAALAVIQRERRPGGSLR